MTDMDGQRKPNENVEDLLLSKAVLFEHWNYWFLSL